MTTLKERFLKDFPEWKNKNAQSLHVQRFFRQELLALVEEILDAHTSLDAAEASEGLSLAASLIRSKANELL